MNGFCGAFSVFSSARYLLSNDPDDLWFALAFPYAGLMFDFMDGKVARWRKSSSMLGQELDSLADLVRRRWHLSSPVYQIENSLSGFIWSGSRAACVRYRSQDLPRYRRADRVHMLRSCPTRTIQCYRRNHSER